MVSLATLLDIYIYFFLIQNVEFIGIGASICIGREIPCFPYAGFFKSPFYNNVFFSSQLKRVTENLPASKNLDILGFCDFGLRPRLNFVLWTK